MYKRESMIKGFILPYLGQQDAALRYVRPIWCDVRKVFGYPTNFAAMSKDDLDQIALRGEQLTRILLAHYCPEI